ncbi:hypothetical protein KKF91_07820 [Myxococcota bacterium]|nr:hypothetical protein [Myxococcota bacterium]
MSKHKASALSADFQGAKAAERQPYDGLVSAPRPDPPAAIVLTLFPEMFF